MKNRIVVCLVIVLAVMTCREEGGSPTGIDDRQKAIARQASSNLHESCGTLRLDLRPQFVVSGEMVTDASCDQDLTLRISGGEIDRDAPSGSHNVLSLEFEVLNQSDQSEFGPAVTLELDLDQAVVVAPPNLPRPGEAGPLVSPRNHDHIDGDTGLPLWLIGALDEEDPDPANRLEPGEVSGKGTLVLDVFPGIHVVDIPFRLVSELVGVSSTIGSDGGYLDHPAGAFVSVPSGELESEWEFRLEEADTPDFADDPQTGVFEISVSPIGNNNEVMALAPANESIPKYDLGLRLNESVPDPDNIALEFSVPGYPQPLYSLKKELNSPLGFLSTSLGVEPIDATVLGDGINLECEDSGFYRMIPETGTDASPIIFIHGIQIFDTDCHDWNNFDPLDFGTELEAVLQAELNSSDYKFYRYTYPTYNSIELAAEDLADELANRFGDRQDVVLVGHSMGGLVATAAVEKYGASSQVSLIITLGTPHEGAEVADPDWVLEKAQLLADLVYRVGLWLINTETDGFKDLRKESDFLTSLENALMSERPFHTFAGNAGADDCDEIQSGLSTTCIIGHLLDLADLKPHDNVVTVTSANRSMNRPDNWSPHPVGLEYYDGYDHFEMRTGDDDQDPPDQLLTDVVQLIAAEIDPDAGTEWNWEEHRIEGFLPRVIWGTEPTDVYAFGLDALISSGPITTVVWHYNGSDWRKHSEFVGAGIIGETVIGSSSSDIYVHTFDKIHHYSGSTWTTFESSQLNRITAMFGTSSSNLWVIDWDRDTTEYRVLQYDGSIWVERLTAVGQPGDWFIPENGMSFGRDETYISGRGGVYKCNEIDCWPEHEVARHPTTSWTGIWGAKATAFAPPTIFAFGPPRTEEIERTTAGTWQNSAIFDDFNIPYLHGVSPTSFFFPGFFGRTIWNYDNGAIFLRGDFRSDTEDYVRDLFSTSENEVWLVRETLEPVFSTWLMKGTGG